MRSYRLCRQRRANGAACPENGRARGNCGIQEPAYSLASYWVRVAGQKVNRIPYFLDDESGASLELENPGGRT